MAFQKVFVVSWCFSRPFILPAKHLTPSQLSQAAEDGVHVRVLVGQELLHGWGAKKPPVQWWKELVIGEASKYRIDVCKK